MALMGDADTGYGNAVNVYFTVRGFEDAGLVGVKIEDQVVAEALRPYEGQGGDLACRGHRRSVPRRKARRDPDFVIKSRTDTLATTASTR